MAELDEFLGGSEPEEEPPVVSEAEPEVAAAVEEPEAEPEPEPAAPEPAEPSDVVGLKAAIQAERAKRNDYKGERDRLAGELAAIKAQMEAAAKVPVVQAEPPAPRQAVAVPNPVEDPEGYHRHNQDVIFNERMNMSELMLRNQITDKADVDAKIEKFRALVKVNPSLGSELRQAVHPWQFAYDTAAKHQALEEIGDPASYRSKLEAEIRASVMAEMAGTAPAPQPRVQLPTSLGTARSAGSRNVPVVNIPTDFDDILAPVRNRNRG